MNKDEIIEIATFFASSKLNRLAWHEGEFSLELEKNTGENMLLTEQVKPLKEYLEANKALHENSTFTKEKGEGHNLVEVDSKQEGFMIRSPVVGTFYLAPSPDEAPFVTVGQKVSKGDVVCIIEAMKVYNEISSPVDGVVKKIFPENQQLLEFDQKIIEIEEL